MEMLADETITGSYPFSIIDNNGMSIVHLNELFSAIIKDVKSGVAPAAIAMKFHCSMAQLIAQMCQRLTVRTGINRVALSGGVFQNRLLLRLTIAALEETGLEVLTHRNVPTNDGGVSLGQAVIANFAGKERD